MVHAPEMMRTHPRADLRPELVVAIEACYDCAQTCVACADACLAEPNVAEMRCCIRLNLDCADVCQATGAVLSRQTETAWAAVRPLVQACIEVCHACGEECGRHAMHMEHCRICAEACRRCEEACRSFVATI